jgi:hypothetical protein
VTTSSLSLALPGGSQVAREWHGVLAPAVGLLVLAAAARTTLCAFGSGVVSLAAAVCGPRKRP